jgi:hypothetical protein
MSNVLFVGGTTAHPQGTNHHLTPSAADRMERIAEQMATFAGPNRFLQHNDASLEWGGSFTALPGVAGTGENPLNGHLAHALGVDIDIAWCYAATSGFTPGQVGRVFGTTCSGTAYVNGEDLIRIADGVGACADAHPSAAGGGEDHYHIRFTGSCQQ